MIQFGAASIKAITNGIGSGVTAAAGASTGSASIYSGSVWLGGVECTVSGSGITLGAGNTGTLYAFAFIPTGNSTTANVDVTSTAPTGTDVAVISVFQFGTGTNVPSNFDTSGLTGARPFGRAQNGSINITYDNALARGGTLIFANDQKLYNGAIEGTLEFASISGANLAKIYGGTWASGGAGSGTWSLSAAVSPLPFMIEFQQITNGVTATYRVLKCYSNSLTLALDRENYLIPSMNFVAIANQAGDIITVQG